MQEKDIMEWFDWIQKNFLIIKDMIKSYEKKLKKRKNGAAKIAMMKMRAMIAKGKAKKLKTPEEKKAEEEKLSKEAGETDAEAKADESADDEPAEGGKLLLGSDPSMDDMKKILG